MMIMIYLLAILCGGCQVKAASTYYLLSIWVSNQALATWIKGVLIMIKELGLAYYRLPVE
jgi:hypothetical protein